MSDLPAKLYRFFVGHRYLCRCTCSNLFIVRLADIHAGGVRCPGTCAGHRVIVVRHEGFVELRDEDLPDWVRSGLGTLRHVREVSR